MTQEQILEVLKELGGEARPVQIARLAVAKGLYAKDTALYGIVGSKLTQLEKWGEVQHLGWGRWKLAPRNVESRPRPR